MDSELKGVRYHFQMLKDGRIQSLLGPCDFLILVICHALEVWLKDDWIEYINLLIYLSCLIYSKFFKQ